MNYEAREPAPVPETLDDLEPGLVVDFRGWKIARFKSRGRGLKYRGMLYAWLGRTGEGGCVRARGGRAILKKIYAEERRRDESHS